MNDKYLCLNCWRISHVNDLIGQPHWREPPDGRLGDLYPHSFWRQTLLGLAPKDPYQLAVQDDREVKCKCGEPMPECAKLPTERVSAIRIIGPKNSGKTFFLITMLDSFNRMQSEEMALRGICDTSQRFGQISSALLKDRRRPEANVTGEPYAWKIMDAQVEQHPMLAFHDFGGQIWEQVDRNIPENLTNYLALPGHLILVLDGARIARDLNLAFQDANPGDSVDDLSILEHITKNWNRQDYNNTKLALVITKADILWEEYPVLREACASLSKTDEKQEYLRQFIIKSGRKALVIFVEQRFRDACIFASSSLGFCPEERDQFERQPEPLGTLLPLLWLLDIEAPV